jgi:hypothetical protein
MGAATSLLTRTSFESASLASQAAIAHPLSQSGRWRLEAYGPQGLAPWAMDILVRDGGLPRLAVDLALPVAPSGCGCSPTSNPSLAPGAMLNLSLARAGDGGFALLYAAGASDPAWDSRRLQAGDYYACLPLRPGLYGAANQLGTAKASIRVTYPAPKAAAATRASAARPAVAPTIITVGEVMDPTAVVIDPSQVLLFAIGAPANLTLDLQSTDDG